MPPSVANEMIFISNADYTPDGYCVVSFSVPSSISSQFVAFFESMFSMFKHAVNRSRHARSAYEVSSGVHNEKMKKDFEIFCAAVLKDFDNFRSQGLSVRESINMTKQKINKRGYRYTSYQIEIIARKNGRLRKHV